MTASAAPAAFHVMAKPTGATCNLDCHYCFFLKTESRYPGSGFRTGGSDPTERIREPHRDSLCPAKP